MDKISFIGLWDIYGGLLTDVQQEITDMYFNLDLTVSEIACEKGVSRQAVSDCLKGCKKQLEGYEEKLHFFERLRGLSLQHSFKIADVAKWSEGFKSAHPELSDEVSALEEILNKDYTAEVSAAISKPETK
ncbi:MAG: DNA-binding protein [Clostridia bacterium]|nr:DNA-binding protein [Clostridia bacterium]